MLGSAGELAHGGPGRIVRQAAGGHREASDVVIVGAEAFSTGGGVPELGAGFGYAVTAVTGRYRTLPLSARGRIHCPGMLQAHPAHPSRSYAALWSWIPRPCNNNMGLLLM